MLALDNRQSYTRSSCFILALENRHYYTHNIGARKPPLLHTYKHIILALRARGGGRNHFLRSRMPIFIFSPRFIR